jgi:hypothetical protein
MCNLFNLLFVLLALFIIIIVDFTSAQQGFSRISKATANTDEDQFYSAAINSEGTIGFFGTATSLGSVVFFDLTTMTRSGASVQNTGETYCGSIGLVEANNFLYCSTDDAPFKIVRHNIATMTRVDATSANSNEDSSRTLTIGNGILYAATYTEPGILVSFDFINFFSPELETILVSSSNLI